MLEACGCCLRLRATKKDCAVRVLIQHAFGGRVHGGGCAASELGWIRVRTKSTHTQKVAAVKAPSRIRREPRPWWVTRLLQLSACLGLKSMISRAVGVSSLLGVSQGHGGSRGSSKVAMSSPENSAEGAKGYRASFQSNGRPQMGRPGALDIVWRRFAHY